MNPSLSPTIKQQPSVPWREICQLMALALGVRLALLIVVFWNGHASWHDFLAHSDAESFLRMARVLVLGDSPATLSFYDRRIFPGWPLIIGPLVSVVPATVALLLPTLLASAALPALFFLLTRCFGAAIVLTCLPPVWLVAGVYPMAEPVFLLCCLGAIMAVSRKAWLIAGALGGFACIIKPYGVFLAAGLAWATLRERNRVALMARLVLAAAGPILIAIALNVFRLGQLAPQFQVYAASLDTLNIHPEAARLLGGATGHWDWPLKALVLTPLRVPTPIWKIAYIYLHLAGALFLAFRAWYQRAYYNTSWEQACLVWLLGNTAASCCAGPYWGFHAFDRYIIWAWPAAVALNRNLFSDRKWRMALPISFLASAYALRSK